MRRVLSVLLSVAPFLAGAVAALSARHDLRLVWMAVAATMAVRVVIAVVPRRRLAFSASVAFVAGVVAAAIAAVLLGARGVVGVGMVALVLAGCAAAGATLSRTVRTP
jgi:hypothetical protein